MAELVTVDITDPSDPMLAPWLGLRDHDARRRREGPGGDMAGHFMAEGDVVIARALRAGHRLDSVLVDAARTSPLEWAGDAMVLRAGPDALTEVCGRPKLRDPIARFVRPPAATVADTIRAARTVAVLEGVVNPTNVGVLMRCAAGLGVEAVLVDPTTCDPLYRRAVRVSMGEVFAIRHARCGPAAHTLGELADAGFTTAALTPSGDVDLDDVGRSDEDRLAVVIGAEGPGLTDAALEAADLRVRIPMAAGVDSINVGTAAAVAFHALRA